MIACISPDIGNCDQTLNTLRYSDRVKERNPETGALSSKCEQPTKVSTLKIPSQSRMPSSVDVSGAVSTTSSVTASDCARQEESYVVTNDDESENSDFVSDTDTDVLDDLLATSAHDPKFTKSTPGLTQSSKRLAGEILVSEHRSVMSAMLAMVKNEMTLVNKVDADRDGLDDYLAQLEVIQETQLKLIEKLRRVSDYEGVPIAYVYFIRPNRLSALMCHRPSTTTSAPRKMTTLRVGKDQTRKKVLKIYAIETFLP
jgi:hypothetical protein